MKWACSDEESQNEPFSWLTALLLPESALQHPKRTRPRHRRHFLPSHCLPFAVLSTECSGRMHFDRHGSTASLIDQSKLPRGIDGGAWRHQYSQDTMSECDASFRSRRFVSSTWQLPLQHKWEIHTKVPYAFSPFLGQDHACPAPSNCSDKAGRSHNVLVRLVQRWPKLAWSRRPIKGKTCAAPREQVPRLLLCSNLTNHDSSSFRDFPSRCSPSFLTDSCGPFSLGSLHKDNTAIMK